MSTKSCRHRHLIYIAKFRFVSFRFSDNNKMQATGTETETGTGTGLSKSGWRNNSEGCDKQQGEEKEEEGQAKEQRKTSIR